MKIENDTGKETKEEKAKQIAQSMYQRGLKKCYTNTELQYHLDIPSSEKMEMMRLVDEELDKLQNY